MFLRNARRLSNNDVSNCRIIEGDVLDGNELKAAVAGQDFIIALNWKT